MAATTVPSSSHSAPVRTGKEGAPPVGHISLGDSPGKSARPENPYALLHARAGGHHSRWSTVTPGKPNSEAVTTATKEIVESTAGGATYAAARHAGAGEAHARNAEPETGA
jgi:hypothetical protein